MGCAEAVPLQFDQIDAIRSKLSEQWPSASELEPDAGAAVSVCVPAVASNIDFDLPRLLQSIGKQTSLPEEVVIVISDTQGKECSDIQRTPKAFCERVALNVLCVPDLQVTPISRNQAAAAATGTILSFIDSDDFMFKERIEVIKKLFAEHQPRMLLHGLSAKQAEPPSVLAAWQDFQLYDGEALFDAAKATEKKQLWLSVDGASEVMHSMVSVDSGSFLPFRPD